MTAELTAAICGNCRFGPKLTYPPDSYGQPSKVPMGLEVDWHGGLPGFGNHAIGIHMCEHPRQPRGMVPTHYRCLNHERDATIDGDATGRLSREPLAIAGGQP